MKSNELIELLKTYNNKELAKFWVSFNTWVFPENFEQFKPKLWEILPIAEKNVLITPIMEYIETVVTEHELNLAWRFRKNSDNELSYEDLEIGMEVLNSDGDIGIVTDLECAHNILVEYDNGGKGLYCLVDNCEYGRDKLYRNF